jgi:hypothetical protein
MALDKQKRTRPSLQKPLVTARPNYLEDRAHLDVSKIVCRELDAEEYFVELERGKRP